MTTYDSSRPSFDLGRVIERTFGAISANFLPFLAMAVVFVGAPQLVLAVARHFMVGDELAARFTPTGFSFGFVGGFVALAGSLIMQAGVMQGTITDLNGEKASIRAMFETGFRYMLPLLGIAIMVFLACMVGMILLVVPGIIAAVMFSVAGPSEVVERGGVFGSMSRSRELTRGHRWMIFFLFLIYWVVLMVFNMVVMGAVGGVAAATGGVAGVVGAGPTLILQVVVTPIVSVVNGVITSAGLAAIYYELRSIKDGIAPAALLRIFD